MGIELELHAERPALDWDRSRATLIRGSYDHGDALAETLLNTTEAEHGSLARVDAYGDTLFDGQQAEAALLRAPALSRNHPSEPRTAAVRDLMEMLQACSRTPGSYLWFVGD
ncbi:hypothetical protein ACFWFI_28260 [Streptomyces sp. NPDC060209]|uniref:hypothetical protein n=1 Tax=Streptomyces sp. NPDC060209 TaxID=3347073 RepID=UPI0036488423